jgi:hypothetical protein
MSWSITGSRVGTVLAVSDSGLPICHGEGQHEPRPPGLNDYGGNINHALLSRIQKSKCAWTIALPSEAPVHIDGNGQGLVERIQQAPANSHGMITFFSEPNLVGIVIVVPERVFAHIRRLLELVLLSESLRYSITLDFLGFRVPNATTSTPTWEEFMSGKPYFFNEITVALRTNDA